MMPVARPGWWVYILRCSDDTLYTGIARDLDTRIAAHRSGQGARYTRSRLPVQVVYREAAPDRSRASQREAQIKQLSRRAKLDLIARHILA